MLMYIDVLKRTLHFCKWNHKWVSGWHRRECRHEEDTFQAYMQELYVGMLEAFGTSTHVSQWLKAKIDKVIDAVWCVSCCGVHPQVLDTLKLSETCLVIGHCIALLSALVSRLIVCNANAGFVMYKHVHAFMPAIGMMGHSKYYYLFLCLVWVLQQPLPSSLRLLYAAGNRLSEV